MKRLFLLALAVLTTGVMFAQTKVTGKVTSAEDGSPVSFASIVVKGTTNMATSGDNGDFVLNNVAQDATLVVSSIGFKTVEVPVNGKAFIDIILPSDTEALEEVMVVAYGTVKKGSYSGSATVVKDDALKDAPVMSFESVLSGKAPGVQVAASSGQPGAQADISIRGFGSFNAGNAPLYDYIDYLSKNVSAFDGKRLDVWGEMWKCCYPNKSEWVPVPVKSRSNSVSSCSQIIKHQIPNDWNISSEEEKLSTLPARISSCEHS